MINRHASTYILSHPLAFALQVLKGFRANQGLLLAGAVAYYSLLSIVPPPRVYDGRSASPASGAQAATSSSTSAFSSSSAITFERSQPGVVTEPGSPTQFNTIFLKRIIC